MSYMIFYRKVAARRVVAFPNENNALNCPTARDSAFDRKAENPILSNAMSAAKGAVKHVHIAVRMQRAADLAHAIAAADPEDARPLMTAALIDLHTGMPPSEALDKDAAQEWAKRAGEAELVAIAEAALIELTARSLHVDQRKGLLKHLYQSLQLPSRLRFLNWAREAEQ